MLRPRVQKRLWTVLNVPVMHWSQAMILEEAVHRHNGFSPTSSPPSPMSRQMCKWYINATLLPEGNCVPIHHPIPVNCLFSGISQQSKKPPRCSSDRIKEKRQNCCHIVSTTEICTVNPFLEVWCQNPNKKSKSQHARWIREVKQLCVFHLHWTKDRSTYLFRWYKQTSRCKQVQAQLSTDLKNYSSCLIVTNCWSVNCGAGQAGHWLLLLNYSTTIHAIHSTHRRALLTENWKQHVWTLTESSLFHQILSISITGVG